MDNYILLHTHSVMALLLLLLVTGVYLYLSNIADNSEAKRYFQAFYIAEIFWQFSDMIRYSLHPRLVGGEVFNFLLVFVATPALVFLFLAYIQFLYVFLGDTFPKERRRFKNFQICFGLATFLMMLWSTYFNHTRLEILFLPAMFHGMVLDIWSFIICFRKYRLLKNTNPDASQGHFYLAIVMFIFISPQVLGVVLGFFTPLAYWNYFILIWAGNLIQLVIFINYGAVPTSFQTKLMGNYH